MGHKHNKRVDRLFDTLAYADVGELAFFLVVAISVLAMPWTILRLARVAWKIEIQQGRTDHHRRIVGMLTTNFLGWLSMLALALLTLWLMLIQ